MIGWFLWTLAWAIFSLDTLLSACSSFLLYMLVTQETIFRRCDEQCTTTQTHLFSSVNLECFWWSTLLLFLLQMDRSIDSMVKSYATVRKER